MQHITSITIFHYIFQLIWWMKYIMKTLECKIKEQDSQVTNNCNQYKQTVHSNAKQPTNQKFDLHKPQYL
jgi:hypothetical protein